MNPKRTQQHKQGSIGSAAFELFVNRELGWIFRSVHQENDFGIDGYIDVVEDGKITGASLAVQIKCGESYFAKKTEYGIRYEGFIKHLNYYYNLRNPVLLVVLDENGENGRWVLFRLEKTVSANSDDRWWIEIPNKNILKASVKKDWLRLSGPTIDIKRGIQTEWAMDKVLSFSTDLCVGIEKHHIQSVDPTSLFLWQEKLTKTREMMLQKRAKVEFFLRGWESDHRELYEINEVRKYFAATLEKNFPWIYWLQPDLSWLGYELLFSCTCNIEINLTDDHRRVLSVNSHDLGKWVETNFNSLNYFTEKNNIPEKINKELSENLIRFVEAKLVTY